MNKKIIIRCIILILISSAMTYVYTYNHCSKQYKVLFNEFAQCVTVKNFEVTSKDNIEVDFFETSFYVDINISGYIWTGPYYLSHIRKSERIENIDGKDVVIVEFAPQLTFTMNLFKMYNSDGNFSKSFRYKLYGYDRTDLTYILRCGEFEEVVHAKWREE